MNAHADEKLIEVGNPSDDPRSFRRTLGKFATGVTVITTQDSASGICAGVTANSFSSLSIDPPLILWSIGRSSRSLDAFNRCSHFAVNILAAGQIDVSQRFASSAADKFEGIAWSPGEGRSPVIDGVAAVLECECETRYDGGDHIILIGRVIRHRSYSRPVLAFSEGQYSLAREHPAVTSRETPAPQGEKPLGIAQQSQLSTLLYEASRVYSSAFEDERRAEGITGAESRLMSFLEREGPCTIDAFVRSHDLTPRVAEDTVAELVEKHLVARAPGGAYSLTQAGRERRAAVKLRGERFEAEHVRNIPDEKLRDTISVLQELIANFGK